MTLYNLRGPHSPVLPPLPDSRLTESGRLSISLKTAEKADAIHGIFFFFFTK